jgi:DNA mismatch repair protein MutS
MTITPAMQQFYDLKEQVPDSLLFFRMWDFYELFWEDAHIAHRVLWISVTTRNKNAENPIPLAWIPYHAKAKYLPQLINAGYKVAIAEQVSDPKLKWLVKREIVRIVTPSTLELEGEEYSNVDNSNILLSITESKNWFWISYLDINSNNWYTWEFKQFDDLKTQLYKISPKEVILDKSLFWNIDIKDVLEKKYWLNIYYYENNKNTKQVLCNHFWVKNLIWFWIEDKQNSIDSAVLLLSYLSNNQKTDLKFLQKISYMSFDSFMNLDESTIYSLDLLYNLSTKSSTLWTLVWILNKTKTSAGNRMLREQIIKPLQSVKEINTRNSFVSEFYNNKILLEAVREQLWYVADIDSILNRIALNRTNPRDLLNLKRSLQSVLEVFKLIDSKGTKKLKDIIKI